MNIEVRAAATIMSQKKGFGVDYSNGKDFTAIAITGEQAETALKALRKQIAEEINTEVGDRLYGEGPLCGRLYQDVSYVSNYCDQCGQRLKLPVEPDN